MGLFNLGDSVLFRRKFDCSLHQARALAQDVLDNYGTTGYEVDLEDTDSLSEARAVVRDDNGTEIEVEIEMNDDGAQTELAIRLGGVVFVGGIKGMMATDSMVQSVALDQLEQFVLKQFDGVRREPDPEPASPPEAAEPEEVEEEAAAGGEDAEADAGEAAADEGDGDEDDQEDASEEDLDEEEDYEEEEEGEYDDAEVADEEIEPDADAAPEGSRFRDTVERIRTGNWDDASQSEKDRAVNEAIQVCSIAAGAVTIQPIPLVDLALVTPIQITMVQLIGSIRGYRMSVQTILEFIGSFGASMITRNLVMALAKLIPVAGWAVSVPTAYAMTFALGKVSDQYFKTGRKSTPSDLKGMFQGVYDKAFGEKQAKAKGSAGFKEKLEELVDAYEADLITEEEFTRKKEQLLDEL